MSKSDQRCVTGKQGFSSKSYAKRHIKRLGAWHGGHDTLNMSAYLCTDGCGLYHIGHAPSYERAWQRERRRAVATG